MQTGMLFPYDVFSIESEKDFAVLALSLFRFQAEHCTPYREYIGHLDIDPRQVNEVEKIPFLPIEFFKSRKVFIGEKEPETVFTSSGTTGDTPSCHHVASISLYEHSFLRGFERFYGPPEQYALFALLPNYLERSGSSLVYMANRLIQMGEGGGFFLREHDEMIRRMEKAAAAGKKILLLGVSFALWELAEKYRFNFPGMTVMETGGMKGQREEITREELHAILCESFGVCSIHSEYGMTELLSQGYSDGDGLFRCPPWMRIVTRDVYDPAAQTVPGKAGGVNVIDLANVFSCAFIETQDLGIRYPDRSFRILGRIDHSEIRGCNLMVGD